MRNTALVLVLLISPSCFAQAFKCKLPTGQTIISESPCDGSTSQQRSSKDWWKQHALTKEEEYFVRGDRCRYFVQSQQPLEGQVRRVLTKQMCPTAGNNFSIVEVDCTKLNYRDMGTSYESPAAIKPITGEWTSTVIGSSKYQLVNHLCFHH